ncbi:manganese efflux pump MntP family protein [Amycolatopsis benzoatilytica]|uniref:manganese efflux pump MntP n=1 Tax=Amycolatopsis benzoatilytica TaxID=346045 RepID=UPI00037AAC1C|nr:manganese efflux pump [Amycolatopsis benzoatilytica]
MFGLLAIGFVLSLDNFRSSLVLGGLKPSFAQSVKTSAIFSAWDGVAPLAGLLLGHVLSEKIDRSADTIIIIGLGAYGVFLVVRAVVSPDRADPDLKWARWGLPIPLSADNVAAGAALGVAGYNPWLAPILFAFATFVMSVAGHQIGRTVARFVDFIPKINTDLLVGVCFTAMAVLMVFGVTLPLSYDG